MKLYDLILHAAGREFRWRGSHEAHAGRGRTATVERWKAECCAHGVYFRMAPLPPAVLEAYQQKRFQGIVVIELHAGLMPELEAPCRQCAAVERMRAA
jgi:hypothetical protein